MAEIAALGEVVYAYPIPGYSGDLFLHKEEKGGVVSDSLTSFKLFDEPTRKGDLATTKGMLEVAMVRAIEEYVQSPRYAFGLTL